VGFEFFEKPLVLIICLLCKKIHFAKQRSELLEKIDGSWTPKRRKNDKLKEKLAEKSK